MFSGDSLIHLESLGSSEGNSLNLSFCISSNGASLISSYSSSDKEYKYVNMIHCADYASIELTGEFNTNLYYFNFVNTSENTNYVIETSSSRKVTIYYSIFLLLFEKKFCNFVSDVSLIDCQADTPIEGFTPTVRNDITPFPIKLDTSFNIKCMKTIPKINKLIIVSNIARFGFILLISS